MHRDAQGQAFLVALPVLGANDHVVHARQVPQGKRGAFSVRTQGSPHAIHLLLQFNHHRRRDLGVPLRLLVRLVVAVRGKELVVVMLIRGLSRQHAPPTQHRSGVALDASIQSRRSPKPQPQPRRVRAAQKATAPASAVAAAQGRVGGKDELNLYALQGVKFERVHVWQARRQAVQMREEGPLVRHHGLGDVQHHNGRQHCQAHRCQEGAVPPAVLERSPRVRGHALQVLDGDALG
mmetsp:Transcript_48982/g.93621  ORF Transcript_48982/g.93621 Transcript_48982/m.93621 type:complete len:236 (-) Transcript_48982:1105-1812(-)